jgi:ABC-type nitrate/sulfonate/bicarbonate transport system permease component
MKDASVRHARVVQAVFVAAVALAWFVMGHSGAVSPLFLPPMEAVWTAFVRLIQTTQFWSAVATTLSTVAEAYAMALVLGVLVGYLVTRSRFLTQVLEPVVSGLFAIPITLFFPLFILLFGIGTAPKSLMAPLMASFPSLSTRFRAFRGSKTLFCSVRARWVSPLSASSGTCFSPRFSVILTG